MSYETDWLRQQIEHWEKVLAQADPSDRETRDRANRELATYKAWLASSEAKTN